MALAVVALIGLVWLGWRIIKDTAAQNLAQSNPEAALAWEPTEATALTRLATAELADPGGDPRTARQLAVRALRPHPLHSDALSILGIIAGRKGDDQDALSLMKLASQRTWRDPVTQSWMLDYDRKHGDFNGALAHADALLRVDPTIWERLFPTLAEFTTSDASLYALVHFLVAEPPWRKWFLSELSKRLANREHLSQIYQLLKHSPDPPSQEEQQPYLTRLIADGQFEQAEQMWRDSLDAAARPHSGSPYNGNFSLPLDGSPFNWVIHATVGAKIEIVAAPDAYNKRALQLEFSGARVTFDVSQLMLLRPGSYKLVGLVKATGFHSERGLWWRVMCAEASNESLAHTDLITGPVPWTEFEVNFTVPASCRAQWLRLNLPARIASERQVAGTVWYRSLRIEQTMAGNKTSRVE